LSSNNYIKNYINSGSVEKFSSMEQPILPILPSLPSLPSLPNLPQIVQPMLNISENETINRMIYKPTIHAETNNISSDVSDNISSNISSNMPNQVSDEVSKANIMTKIINLPATESKTEIGKCSVDTCGLENLHPILDPKFNMRETAKQCLLLEDHLNNVKKRCFDCIRKHFLIIDGFLEEAVSLEKDNTERNAYRSMFLEWVKLEKQYALNPKNSDNLDELSKKIRLFRKPLVEKYFDTVSEYSE
jgi:hypothetical protein